MIMETTTDEKAATDFSNKMLLSLEKLKLTDKWIPQPENTQVECTFAYNGDGEHN